MREIQLQKDKCGCYVWKLFAKNGRLLALSKVYATKFHCKKGAIQALRKPYTIIDLVKDRRKRA